VSCPELIPHHRCEKLLVLSTCRTETTVSEVSRNPACQRLQTLSSLIDSNCLADGSCLAQDGSCLAHDGSCLAPNGSCLAHDGSCFANGGCLAHCSRLANGSMQLHGSCSGAVADGSSSSIAVADGSMCSALAVADGSISSTWTPGPEKWVSCI
jgi:hypothetical protein